MIRQRSGMFEMNQFVPIAVINVMRSSINARVLKKSRAQVIYHISSLLLPWRLRGEICPSHCDGSGKNLLKSDTHTLTCHYKAQAWTLKMQWSGSRNRVRFDYILENRFGMYDSREAHNLQLLSTLAFLLLVQFYVAGSTAPGLLGLWESVNVRCRVFGVWNRRRATNGDFVYHREACILHCWERSHSDTNFGGKSLLRVPLQGL